MSQRTFDDLPPRDEGHDDGQDEEIARVRGAIARTVLEFARAVGVGVQFHADDLREYVAARHKVAPGSADRILRDLRSRKLLDYVNFDRGGSLYRITELAA